VAFPDGSINNNFVDRAIVSTAPLKIYFQNISGMRKKAEQVYLATSQCEFDVIVLVETWLNINFYSKTEIARKPTVLEGVV